MINPSVLRFLYPFGSIMPIFIGVLLPLSILFAWQSDNGDGTYTNPPIYGDYPDPDIIRVGDDFYFSTTTFVNVPGLSILHSKDLVNWELLSHVVQQLDGHPAYDMQDGETAYRHGLFASSLRHHDGVFYLAVTPVGQNTRIYRSNSAGGPWELSVLDTSAFDPGLFFDDDGTGYIATSGGWDGTVTLLTLNADYTKVIDAQEIFYNKGGEGSKLVKRKGWYYMFHSIPSKLALTVSRARALTGTWETREQIDDHSGGHQGAIVDLPDGSDYGFVMIDSGPIGRMTNISPIFWEDDWPVWGTPEAPGRVPTVAEKPVKGFPLKILKKSDDFESEQLGLQWQWNHNPLNSHWSLVENPGWLRLYSSQSDDFWTARNTLIQKALGPWCRGDVKLDLSGMQAGDVCGFGTFGKINGSIAVHCYAEGQQFLAMRVYSDGEGTDTRVRYMPLSATEIFLRTEVNFVSETALCSYSVDGQNWEELGGEFAVQYDWRTGTFQGVQFGLHFYNTEGDGGYVDLDGFTFYDISTTYEQWAQEHFYSDSHFRQSGFWADPDGDGLNNATEFLNKRDPNLSDSLGVIGKILPSDPVGSYYIEFPSLESQESLEEQLGGRLSALNLEVDEVSETEKNFYKSEMPDLALDGWAYNTLKCKGNICSVFMLVGALLEKYNVPISFDWFDYSGQDLMTENNLDAGTYRNPILTGFYPDPSICQVGNDYYLINSTFAYFPGLPVFHSTDLVNWNQIGNVIDRVDQLNYDGKGVSRGLFAPAITYHDGLFYVVCTMIDGRGNFVVTAENPAGPWSDPVFIPFEGIDPSLFFDDDGRAWMVNNGAPEGTSLYDGHRAIWLQEFDYKEMKMIGPRKVLVNGGVDLSTKPIWIEGPHLLKRGGVYYLSCAEGGTGPGHSQVIFRSRSVDGIYEPWEGNPILTQRDLDPSVAGAVTCTGHADYVTDSEGNWWSVFLGVRPYEREFSPMGRETFLLPVTWTEDDWPTILPHKDRVPLLVQSPGGSSYSQSAALPMSGDFGWQDSFDNEVLSSQWIYLRAPEEKWWTLNYKTKTLSLVPRKETLSGKHNPSYLGKRIQHSVFNASLSLKVPSTFGVSAGLAVFQNEFYHFFAAIKLSSKGPVIYLEKAEGSNPEKLVEVDLPKGSQDVAIRVSCHQETGRFEYSVDDGPWIVLVDNVDAKILTTTKAGGFVGATTGPHVRLD